MGRQQNLAMRSGDDQEIQLTVIDARTGTAMDLTGVQNIQFALARETEPCDTRTVRRYGTCGSEPSRDCLPMGEPVFEKELGNGIEILDAVAGTATITIDSADTEPLCGRYYYEVRLTTAAGKKSTILYGRITIRENLIKD